MKKSKLIAFSETHWKMIEEIQEKRGYKTANAVIFEALPLLHARCFPDYVKLAKERENMTPEERAKRAIEDRDAQKKARIAKKEQQKMDIVKQLEGELTPDGKYCKFEAYSLLKFGKEIRVMSTNIEEIPMSMIGFNTLEIKYKGRASTLEEKIEAVRLYKENKAKQHEK